MIIARVRRTRGSVVVWISSDIVVSMLVVAIEY